MVMTMTLFTLVWIGIFIINSFKLIVLLQLGQQLMQGYDSTSLMFRGFFPSKENEDATAP